MRPRHLTTKDCADILEVSPRFIRDEIRSGRLTAEVIERACLPGRAYAQAVYRVYPEHFKIYIERHWPRVAYEAEVA